MIRRLKLFLAFAAAFPSSVDAAQGDPLREAIIAQDAEYFDVYFNGCDPARARLCAASFG